MAAEKENSAKAPKMPCRGEKVSSECQKTAFKEKPEKPECMILTHEFSSCSFFQGLQGEGRHPLAGLAVGTHIRTASKKDFISIDEDFISSLGSEYLRTLVSLAVV